MDDPDCQASIPHPATTAPRQYGEIDPRVRPRQWSPSTIRILRVPIRDLACSRSGTDSPLASNLLITCPLDLEAAMTRSISARTACRVLTALLFATLAGCGGSSSSRPDGLAGGSAISSGGVVNSGGVAGGGTSGTKSTGGTTAAGGTVGSGGVASSTAMDAGSGDTGSDACSPTLYGQPCADEGESCVYPSHQCRCTSGVWLCSICPASAPNTGGSCADITSVCRYDAGATQCTCGGIPLPTWSCT